MASVLGLEPEYRGKGLSDKLVDAMLSLCSSYDYILVPVSKKLNTHTFWARYGAVNVCDDGNNIHYILTKNKSLLSELGTSRLSEDKVHGIVRCVMRELL
jgi:GNAT superfamily N-acetyltransferase